jgi:hypothetical protein
MSKKNKCPEFKGFPAAPTECVNIPPIHGRLFYNSETKEVYDEFNNLIGSGELIDGKISVRIKTLSI